MFNRDNMLLARAAVGRDVATKIVYTYPTGSNYTCDPPVETTDIDFFAFTHKPVMNGGVLTDAEFWSWIIPILQEDGWAPCADEEVRQAYSESEGYYETWQAFRKGRFNMLLTHSYAWFAQGAAASELCKALNLLDKDDRCSVHDMLHPSYEGYIKAPTNLIARQFVASMQAHNWWNPPVSSINFVGAPIHPPAPPVPPIPPMEQVDSIVSRGMVWPPPVDLPAPATVLADTFDFLARRRNQTVDELEF